MLQTESLSKQCSKCGTVKAKESFWLGSVCRACKASYDKIYAKANIERKRSLNRAWRNKNKEKANERLRALRARNKLAGKRYFRKDLGYPDPTRAVPEVCDCCGKPPGRKSLALDHDHVTGRFRGWLCGRCNTAIGSLGDGIEGLQQAMSYLIRSMSQ